MHNSPGCGKKRTAYKSNPTRRYQESKNTRSTVPALRLAYTTANKVFKTEPIS
jgi:hypothetical protein